MHRKGEKIPLSFLFGNYQNIEPTDKESVDASSAREMVRSSSLQQRKFGTY